MMGAKKVQTGISFHGPLVLVVDKPAKLTTFPFASAGPH